MPVHASRTWIWGLLLFAYLFGSQAGLPLSDPRLWIAGALFLVSLVMSVVLHETAHALAARAAGYQVRHIMLTLWGGQTSYTALRPRPLPVALVSLAGPATNLAIAGVLLPVGVAWGDQGVAAVAITLALWMNLFLGIFNALPGLPMDGGQAVASIGWAVTGSRASGMRWAVWSGRVVAAGVAVMGIWLLARGSLVTGVWTCAIAGFLVMSGTSSLRAAAVRERWETLSFTDISHPAVLVPSATPLAQAYVMAPRPDQALLVSDDGVAVLGVVEPQSLGAEWSATPVSRLMQPCAVEPMLVDEDSRAIDLVAALATDGTMAVALRLPSGEPRVITQNTINHAFSRQPPS